MGITQVFELVSQRFDKYNVCNYYTNKKAPPMNGQPHDIQLRNDRSNYETR